MRRLLVAAAALAAAAAAATSPAAAAPCWRAVVLDWSDGGINHAHPLACYRSALRNLPEDLRIYSSAPGDIERALRYASRPLPHAGASRRLQSRPARTRTARATAAAAQAPQSVPVPLLVLAGLAGVLVSAAGTSVTLRALTARRRRD